ncbi:MAG: hypothetical protein R3C55_08720 [Parvularculaceae bacterium]
MTSANVAVNHSTNGAGHNFQITIGESVMTMIAAVTILDARPPIFFAAAHIAHCRAKIVAQ